jgi:hypothetical protein
MTPDRLPKYLILIRWGDSRFELVGKAKIIAAATLLATVIGAKILHVYF